MGKTFADHFEKIIAEDMTTADAGVGSTNVSGEPKQGDFYAPDDTRIAKPLGKVATRRGTAGSRAKTKAAAKRKISKLRSKKRKSKKVYLPGD